MQYVWSARYIDAPILRDRDADGNPNTGNLGKTGSGLEERIYYLTDANMNVTTLVDTGGDALERYVYDPYGKVTIYDDDWSETRNSSSYANSILFGGYYRDNETGLYYVRNRTYHPNLGRWLQRDPLGYVDGPNLYEYVRSAPLGATDPMGLGEWVETALGFDPGNPWNPWWEKKEKQEDLWDEADQLQQEADDLDKEADELEKKGRKDDADNLRRMADRCRQDAEDLEAEAEDTYKWWRDVGLTFAADLLASNQEEVPREEEYEAGEEGVARRFRDTFRAFRQWELQPEIDDLRRAEKILGHSDPYIDARLEQIELEIYGAGVYGEEGIHRTYRTAETSLLLLSVTAGGAVAVETGSSLVGSAAPHVANAWHATVAGTRYVVTTGLTYLMTHPATVDFVSGVAAGHATGYSGGGSALSPPTGSPAYDLGYRIGNVVGTVQSGLGL